MQENLNDAWAVVLEYWLVISTVLMAVLMAVFRTAKATGKVDWLEAVMCGLFAYGIWFSLSFMNIPEGVGVLVGGMVGYKGTALVSKWIGNKLGINLDK